MNDIKIGQLTIGPSSPPFIVAEMSGNHNQSLERALSIVDAAAAAGATALKIQTYTADTMTLDLNEGDFTVRDPNSLWAGQSLYGLYKKAYTPWEWHEAIFARCRQKGLLGFSTPFDLTAVDFLEKLHVPLYKIASFENVDHRLIRAAAKTGKPLIISTGMATADEVGEAVDAARSAGCKDLILLKCTSAYPAPIEAADLATIPDLAARHRCLSGLSDHTMGNVVAIAAVALGAVMVEKHFTLRRADGGVDSAFSMEPQELACLVADANACRKAVGRVSYGPTEHEKNSLRFRRSLYIAVDMRAGDVFTNENLKAVRPGNGLPTKFFDSLIGKPVKRDVKAGTPASLDLI